MNDELVVAADVRSSFIADHFLEILVRVRYVRTVDGLAGLHLSRADLAGSRFDAMLECVDGEELQANAHDGEGEQEERGRDHAEFDRRCSPLVRSPVRKRRELCSDTIPQ